MKIGPFAFTMVLNLCSAGSPDDEKSWPRRWRSKRIYAQ